VGEGAPLPHSPPSNAHFFAATTEHRRGSVCVALQSEIIMTGYRPCSARISKAASGSKDENLQ